MTNPERRDDFVKSFDLHFCEAEYPEIYLYLRESSRGLSEPEYLEKLLASGDKEALIDVINGLDEQSSIAFTSAVLKTDSLAFVIELGIDVVLQSTWKNVKQLKYF